MADLAAFSGFHPYVLTAWGSDIMGLPPGGARQGLVTALKHADAVTGDSPDLCEAMVRLGAAKERTHLILWGVDTERFSPGPTSEHLVRNLGIAGANVVISLRKFRRIYNQQTVVEAIPRVLAKRPGTVFLFADCPSPENGPWSEYRACRELAEKLGVDHACRWVEGGFDHDGFRDALRAAHVCLTVPSRDATSVSMLESMAVGLPVIATDLPANREWIRHGETGYLVPIGDVDALADAVVDLLADETKRLEIGNAARAVVVERASQEVHMRKMERIYEQVAGEGNADTDVLSY